MHLYTSYLNGYNFAPFIMLHLDDLLNTPLSVADKGMTVNMYEATV